MNSTKSQTQKTDFPSLLERYFCEYLLKQRNASPETISSYRDTFRLFLQFSQQRFRKAPASLTLGDLDAAQILAFLDTLESQRHNCVRSRNLRLAVLRSFLRYAALQDPTAPRHPSPVPLPSLSNASIEGWCLISRAKK